MHEKQALITAYLLDGQGGGRNIGWEEIDAWTPDQGLLWVHLNYSVKKSLQWLKKSSGLDKYTIHSLTASETRPRTVVGPNGLLVLLRGVNLNPGQDPEDMVSVRTWIDSHRIITTRRQKLLSVQDVADAIDVGQGPKTPAEFLIVLNDRLIDRIGDAVDGLATAVDNLEEAVLVEESYQLRPKIADVRRQSILIRRYLAPQRDALYRLQMEETKWLSADDRLHLRESNDRIIRFIEDLDSSRERSAVTQEELSSRLSEQMDKRMYVLSLVAVIFLPLTFITGLLGINVEGIPGAKYQHAFAVVCGILIVIFVGLYAAFKRKKWM